MSKIADRPPPFCAACFQADPEARYVDFEAAYDGPVVPGTPEPVPVDDLIICERCLSEAFGLLDPQGLLIEQKRLNDLLETAAVELDAKDKLIGRLETATHELVRFPIERMKGQQVPAGVPADVRRELIARRAKRSQNPKEKVS